jgi:hypothetical protein
MARRSCISGPGMSRDNSSCHSISAPAPAVRIPGLNTSLGIASTIAVESVKLGRCWRLLPRQKLLKNRSLVPSDDSYNLSYQGFRIVIDNLCLQ